MNHEHCSCFLRVLFEVSTAVVEFAGRPRQCFVESHIINCNRNCDRNTAEMCLGRCCNLLEFYEMCNVQIIIHVYSWVQFSFSWEKHAFSLHCTKYFLTLLVKLLLHCQFFLQSFWYVLPFHPLIFLSFFHLLEHPWHSNTKCSLQRVGALAILCSVTISEFGRPDISKT